MTSTLAIEWTPGRRVTARLTSPEAPTGAPILLAHGAGAGQDHPGVVLLRDGLTESGHVVLTFNYPYMEQGRQRPDRREVLMQCHRAALERLGAESEVPAVLAGRSMGGRIGSLLAAEEEPCAAVVLYAYPLHPPGRPDSPRTDHLTAIRVPMLFFTGTRDPMARSDLVERWLRPLPKATVELLQDADHSFRVPKKSGRTQGELLAWIASRTAAWLREVVR